MEITEIRVQLAGGRSGKLKAFATVTFDGCFVVRDIKIISGARGLFVAMPSRRLNARCRRCHAKNHLRARYCSQCGTKLSRKPEQLDDRGRAKLHADIAHPINQACRDLLQEAAVKAYQQELARSKEAGYEPPPYEFSDEFAEDAGPEDLEPDDAGLEGADGGDGSLDAGTSRTETDSGGAAGDPASSDGERRPRDGDSDADGDLGIFA